MPIRAGRRRFPHLFAAYMAWEVNALYHSAESSANTNEVNIPVETPHVDRRTYWRGQIRRTSILLAIWAIVGFFLSILFVEELNQIHLGDMPLGFWMAQQGSIFIFILLILIYAVLSGRADKAAGLDDRRPGRLDAAKPTEG